MYEASAPIEGHGGRFLVCNDNRLTWVDEEGRNVWQYGTNLDSLDKVMPNATPVERPVLTDFIVEDVLSDRPGDEVVLIWTHPEWPVSCLQIASADGGYVGDPLWSFGRLTSVVLLSGPTGKLLVVAGESHSIFDYEPSLADWGTKMKISRLNVPRNPPILFGIKPENAHGLVPPFMGVPYLSMATLEWLLVRKCDTNKELTDYGWNLTIRNIEPATRPDSFNAVVSVSKNTSGMRTGDPMLFRISFDAYGRRIDSVGFSRWALRSTAEPTLNLLRIEPERLTLIVTAIFENQRQTGSALRMKQLLRRSSWFTSDDTPWIEGVVDRLWSSPIAINNAVWLMICTGSTPDVDVCEEWLDSMTLALTDPGVPVEVRRAVQNTIGELHFLNGDLDRARTVLSESICQSSDPVYSVARLVSICWKQNDLDAVKHYLELLKSLVAKRQAGYDRFREKLLREAEDIERDMRARKTPKPPST